MKLIPSVAVSIVIQFAIATLLAPSLGHKVLDRYNGNDDTDTQSTSRLLDVDAACSNACDTDHLRRFRSPFLGIKVVEKSNDQGLFHRLFGRATFFSENKQTTVGSWMNGLFGFWNRRVDDNDHKDYLIPTEPIVSLFSNSSIEIMSLITLLRLEGESHADSSSSADIVTKLYNLSAENMESVVTVLDQILVGIQQSDMIDIRVLSCLMIDISNLLLGITVPNIEFIADAVYANPANVKLKRRFYEYNKIAAVTETSSTTAVSKNNNNAVCLLYGTGTPSNSASTTTNVARQFTDADLGRTSTTKQQSGNNLILLPLYILYFPISIVIGLIGIIFTIVLLPILLLLFPIALVPPNNDDANNVEILLRIVGIVLLQLILAPLIALYNILDIILGIVRVLLSLIPTESSSFIRPIYPPPTVVPKIIMSSLPPTVTPQQSNTEEVSIEETLQTVQHHLLAILESSPLERIQKMFQSENTFRGIDENDRYDMECELARFQCQTTALMNILPF